MSDKVFSGNFFVYGLCDPRTGHLRYIGKTRNGMKRVRHHFSPSKLKKDGTTRKANWVRSLLKLGLKPEIFLIEEFDSDTPLNESEIFHIAYFKSIGCNLTNLTVGGDGTQGSTRSLEQRAHLSVCATKQMNSAEAVERNRQMMKKRWEDPLFRSTKSEQSRNHKHSLETKLKISSSNKGRKLTNEQRSRMGEALLGIPLSAEHRAKISASRKGQKLSSEHRAKISASHILLHAGRL